VLEVGPGTGQTTLPLARRGLDVTAVEMGAGLAAVAARRLARFPRVEIVEGAFEHHPLPQAAFDLVLAATAWHWIDPATRLARAAHALRPGGCIALISTHHVAGGTRAFFDEVQENCYTVHMGEDATLRLSESDDVPPGTEGIDAGGRFDAPAVRRYHQDIAYTSAT